MNKNNTLIILMVFAVILLAYFSARPARTIIDPVPATDTLNTVNPREDIKNETGKTPNSKPRVPTQNGRVRAPVEIILEKGQTQKVMGGLSVSLLSVSDSRCPEDVQCISAGTVTASLKLINEEGASKTMPFNLGEKPIVYAGYEVSITNVTPLPKSGPPISSSDYRVTARVASSSANTVDNPDAEYTGPSSDESTQKACTDSGGTWDGSHRECTGISELSCKEIKGTWNECGSACRHNPNAQMCTMQCVQFCQF